MCARHVVNNKGGYYDVNYKEVMHCGRNGANVIDFGRKSVLFLDSRINIVCVSIWIRFFLRERVSKEVPAVCDILNYI